MRLKSAFDVYRHLDRAMVTPSKVRTAAEQWRAKNVMNGGGEQYETPLTENATPIPAYVNHGRWLVDCDCGNGAPIAQPEGRSEAVCFSCGTVWTRITFAEEPDDVSAILSRRPHATWQHWRPGETLEQLRAENDAHGIGETR